MTAGPSDQAGCRRTLDWGPAGLARLAPGAAGVVVVAGCLRDAGAVGRAAAAMAGDGTVAVVAAGEREPAPGTGLRFPVEDLLGAGAVLAAAGTAGASAEALAAIAFFEAAAHDLPARLLGCGSGRELAARGLAGDVAVAADLDASTAVPVLRDGAFVPLQ